MKYVSVLGLLTLFSTIHAQAMLLDCATAASPGLAPKLDCAMIDNRSLALAPGAAPTAITPPPSESRWFTFNPPRSANLLEESAPLVIFFSIVIAVFLVRTKSLNTK